MSTLHHRNNTTSHQHIQTIRATQLQPRNTPNATTPPQYTAAGRTPHSITTQQQTTQRHTTTTSRQHNKATPLHNTIVTPRLSNGTVSHHINHTSRHQRISTTPPRLNHIIAAQHHNTPTQHSPLTNSIPQLSHTLVCRASVVLISRFV